MKDSWDKDIERLLELKANGELNETDYDEVAEKHNTTREEVINCCISESIDNGDYDGTEDDND